eukprot:1121991-Rhodomonas_salina.6
MQLAQYYFHGAEDQVPSPSPPRYQIPHLGTKIPTQSLFATSATDSGIHMASKVSTPSSNGANLSRCFPQ